MTIRLFAAIFAFAVATLAQTPSSTSPTAKHPFTFEDMMKLKRLSEPVPSPDGKWVVFAAEDVDLEANTKISHLWIVPAAGGPAAAGRRLNETPNHEERPRFSPDGKRLIWTSKATDPTQIWMCDFDGNAGALVGKPHQVTNISTGADGAIWSPDGKNIVFVSSVYPDAKDDAENKRRDEELKNSKVKAKIFNRLFYRHWNAFYEFKRSHLFVVSAEAGVEAGVSPEGTPGVRLGQPPLQQEARDLTPGDHDVPPFHLGGQDMYAISPDGQELAYTSNIDEVEATSTNNEIFVVPMAGGTPKKISTSPGSDSTPLYSPDGKYVAWRSQARAGFEADKWRLFAQDRQSGQTRDLTEKFDRSVASFAWAPGLPEPHRKFVRPILFAAEDHGEAPIWIKFPEDEEPPAKGAQLHADDLIFSSDALYFTRMSIAAPNEIWRLEFISPQQKHDVSQVTHLNDELLAKIDMQPLESFTFKGANDEDVQDSWSSHRDSIRRRNIR